MLDCKCGMTMECVHMDMASTAIGEAKFKAYRLYACYDCLAVARQRVGDEASTFWTFYDDTFLIEK